MFLEFVEAWNGRRLPARLYRGETGGGPGGAAPRTSHNWGLKSACAVLVCVRESDGGWVGGRVAGGPGSESCAVQHGPPACPAPLPPHLARPAGSATLAASGAVGMAAALDEDLTLKDAARAQARAAAGTGCLLPAVSCRLCTHRWVAAGPQGQGAALCWLPPPTAPHPTTPHTTVRPWRSVPSSGGRPGSGWMRRCRAWRASESQQPLPSRAPLRTEAPGGRA